MKFDPQIHHRHSIRLKDFDYSQAGAYFVTFVTQNRITMFGKIVEGVMQMNQLGQITQNTWNNYKISSPFNTMNG
jgi:putative transposase